MKKTFKQIINDINPPKKLLPEEKLPQIFDTLFDVKYGSDILENWYNVLSKKRLYSLLAEHGYDAKDIKENHEKQNKSF